MCANNCWILNDLKTTVKEGSMTANEAKYYEHFYTSYKKIRIKDFDSFLFLLV